MANPPNFIDLARAQRLAASNRLSFNSIVNAGSPGSQSIPNLQPTPTPTPTPTITPTPTPLPQFSTFADLKTNSEAQQINNQSVYVQGYYAAGDGGEGTFTFNSASLSADDAGAFVKPSNVAGAGRWVRQFNNDAKPEMWGARGNGTTDDQPAIQRAIRFVELTPPYKLFFDCKTYLLSTFAWKLAKLFTKTLTNLWITMK